MQRIALSAFLLVTFMLNVLSADGEQELLKKTKAGEVAFSVKEANEKLKELGEKLLVALKEKDKEKFIALWVTSKQMLVVMSLQSDKSFNDTLKKQFIKSYEENVLESTKKKVFSDN